MVIVGYLGGLYENMVFDRPFTSDIVEIGLTTGIVCSLIACVAMSRGANLKATLEILLVIMLCCVDTMDLSTAASVSTRQWTAVVVLVDVALVVGLSEGFTRVLIVIHVAWLVVESSEATYRYGLYDVANFGNYRVPKICSCSQPPCEKGLGVALASLVASVMVFVLDFYFTRGFARGMQKQMSIVEATVSLAARVTELLARYEVDDAQKLVDGDAGKALPQNLRTSFTVLLSNLQQYKPYLPDALLRTDASEDGAPTDIPAAVAVRAPGVGEDAPHVSMCFTDIQSSTELWESCPQGMFDGLRLHNKVMRRCAGQFNGYEVKIIGDAFMLAFDAAADAVAFALSAQESLATSEWPPELVHPLVDRVEGPAGVPIWNGPRVRIGLHAGNVRVEHNPVTGRHDYFGQPVNTAARIEAAVKFGGLIGISERMWSELPEGTVERLGSPTVVPMGDRTLKGVQEPVTLLGLLPAKLAARESVLQQPSQMSPAQVGSTASFSKNRGSAQLRGLTLRLVRLDATCAAVRIPLPALGSLEKDLPALLQAIEKAADVTQGVVYSVMSAVSTVMWNASESCRDHVSQCFHFSQVLGGRSLRVGAATGAALCGNVAGGRRRHATAFGGCVELATALAEEAEVTGEYTLCAGPVADVAMRAGCARRACVFELVAAERTERVAVWAVWQQEEKWGRMVLHEAGSGAAPPDDDVRSSESPATDDVATSPGATRLLSVCGDECPRARRVLCGAVALAAES
eukprot:TRINITY_DN6148_c0_g4_i3.p1 TRINITY_DN6148_c0_g4~~TRINITY_DN6148_c0_g4_i3.p1  ORF type:complete len:746 (+),score=226.30 TRINITY_DN6148_c0_g4_i3:274-2511(+)